jgi:hypothetical protein
MTAAARVLSTLPTVRQTGPGRWLARCPAHDDRRASLSVREIDGRVLIHCFAGCSAGDVVSALGLSLCDLFERPLAQAVESSAPRVNATDVLVALAHEAMVVVLVCEALAEGQPLDADKRSRLNLAAGRIIRALDVVVVPEMPEMRRIRRGESRQRA